MSAGSPTRPETAPGKRPTLSAAGNRIRLATAGGLVAVTAYVAGRNPEAGGAYPLCPSRAVLGLDCPLCGGLRGTHALLNGRVADALDYNLLLPGLLAAMVAATALWLLPVVGRTAPTVRLPNWAVAAAVILSGAFTVLRNLPVSALEFLASDPR